MDDDEVIIYFKHGILKPCVPKDAILFAQHIELDLEALDLEVVR